MKPDSELSAARNTGKLAPLNLLEHSSSDWPERPAPVPHPHHNNHHYAAHASSSSSSAFSSDDSSGSSFAMNRSSPESSTSSLSTQSSAPSSYTTSPKLIADNGADPPSPLSLSPVATGSPSLPTPLRNLPLPLRKPSLTASEHSASARVKQFAHRQAAIIHESHPSCHVLVAAQPILELGFQLEGTKDFQGNRKEETNSFETILYSSNETGDVKLSVYVFDTGRVNVTQLNEFGFASASWAKYGSYLFFDQLISL